MSIKIDKKIVIIYTYYETQISIFNLNYFIKNEVRYRENIDYILIINGKKCSVSLPIIKNLNIIKRKNTGYDFGGYYVALKYIKKKKLKYNFYIFMNSGVFGPVIPHYLKNIHWSKYFIDKINKKVKLVGTTIVCLPHDDLGGYGPKVEGFFFVTDKVGVHILKKEKTVFKIHKNKLSAIINGEYGLSNCILKNGYSIDCMIRKYQGIDWTDKKNWNLNNNQHSSRKNSFYGQTLLPYELIFHKWYWKNKDFCNLEIIKQYEKNKC